jgi:hypothetical protein
MNCAKDFTSFSAHMKTNCTRNENLPLDALHYFGAINNDMGINAPIQVLTWIQTCASPPTWLGKQVPQPLVCP